MNSLFACGSLTLPWLPVDTALAHIHVHKEPLSIIQIKKSQSEVPHGHNLYLLHALQLTLRY